jgi:DNA sulfur modification protein DndE
MLPRRVKISKNATDSLKLIKGRTGLTPNIAARFALILSLENSGSKKLQPADQVGSEFNAPTLFGDHALLFECLLREAHGTLDQKEAGSVIAAHIEDGVKYLRGAKSLTDFLKLTGFEPQSN